MSDQQNADDTPDNKPDDTPTFDMEFVPELPDGRAVAPVETDGSFTWLVAEGHMTKQCLDEMSEYLRHIVTNGKWRQRWDDGPERPQAPAPD